MDRHSPSALLAGNAGDLRTVHRGSLPVIVRQLFRGFAHATILARRIARRARRLNAPTWHPVGPAIAVGIVGSV